jgi:tetratricopeptide (TPR) repeat protein
MKATAAHRSGSSTVISHLRAGLVHHQARRLSDAEACYRRALDLAPQHPDALHLLGALLLERGDLVPAVTHLERAVRARPDAPDYELTLGNAWLALGDRERALAAYHQAVRIDPSGAGARSNLGHVLRLEGRLDEAARQLEAAIALDPALPDPLINLGLVELDRQRPKEAAALLERAVRLAPRSALARFNLGTALQALGQIERAAESFQAATALDPSLPAAWRGLGVTLQLLGRADVAAGSYRRAIALDHADVDSLTNLGVILTEQGDFAGALAAHDAATAVAPEIGGLRLNCGTTLQQMGRLEEAIASFEQAAALDPKSAAAWTALGSARAEHGDWVAAEEAHRRALGVDPESADPHWNLALALLGAGRLEAGWDEYEWRWQASTCPGPLRPYPVPLWHGEPLEGRRLLVWREQGLGDEILFLTILDDLIRSGAEVTVLASPRLVSLLARRFPTADVRPDAPEAVGAGDRFDWHLPLGSLPRWTRRAPAAFRAGPPLFTPTPATRARWTDRLAPLGPGPKLGLCWRSGLVTAARQRAYAPLDLWSPLLTLPGITWVNLQYDDCEAELQELEARTGVRVARWPGEDLKQDLESVVGLLAGLDGVVTAPTAVSSLAGAVGRPTWQVDNGSDWTVFGGTVSPWFPSLTVMARQPAERGWEPVLARTAAAVAAWQEAR